MCGIVAYIGNRNITEVLLNTLSKLEYRGYDSAGMAAIESGKISIQKERGKLNELRTLLEKRPFMNATVGVGHTRWATHGEPNRTNAHPHTSFHGSVAVVHNGIIENYAFLRMDLESKGYTFSSDTDTETIVQLIDMFMSVHKFSFMKSVLATLKRLNGSYAFCVISENDPDCIIAARNGSPLIIGLGEHENFVASDVPAILDYTRDVIYLNDFEVAMISRTSVEVFDIKGNPIKKAVKSIDWTAEQAQKGGYQHFMLKEIEEQPEIVEKILKHRVTSNGNITLIDEGSLTAADIQKFDKVIIQACGTSWHAALLAKYLFEELSGMECEVDVSSEFRYRESVFARKTLLLTISQSGETIDALMGMRKAKESAVFTYSLCNVVGSTITRESNAVTYLLAGPEISVASTKAYTAQITTLYLLCAYFGLVRGYIQKNKVMEIVQELLTIPAKMRSIIERRQEIKHIADSYALYRDFIFLGRGYNYPSVMEGALKIKEIAYLHATGHPAGEMKHGPIALIDANVPVICAMPFAKNYEKMLSNVREVSARKGILIGIVSQGDTTALPFLTCSFAIPKVSEMLSPSLIVLCFQYLAYFVAVARGLDVDQPRNLAKSVTVE